MHIDSHRAKLELETLERIATALELPLTVFAGCGIDFETRRSA